MKKTTAPPPVRHLETRSGRLVFPAYIPVTTFGKKYPLDELIRPFLPRLASAIMVSHHYARQAEGHPGMVTMVDSGGFASLFDWAKVKDDNGLGVIVLKSLDDEEVLSPDSVLSFQEQWADIAFTLDFPIPPSRAESEGQRRQSLTIANALWALRNRRRRDLPLYACIQGWDVDSYLACADAYVDAGFDGVAIGGLVPRVKDKDLIEAVVTGVRERFPNTPLHVFGLGLPHLVRKLYELGVDSVDSSAYVKLAADGKSWDRKTLISEDEVSPLRRMHLAIANLATASQRALPMGFAQIMYAPIKNRS